jgi:hypothetical protein
MVGPAGVTNFSQPHSNSREEIIMGKVIEFYIPMTFRTPLKGKLRRRGKVIEICTQARKSA